MLENITMKKRRIFVSVVTKKIELVKDVLVVLAEKERKFNP